MKDEIKMASEISEREKVYELFERAVKDYICKSFKNALKWVVLHPDLAFFVVFIGKSSFCYNAEIESKFQIIF